MIRLRFAFALLTLLPVATTYGQGATGTHAGRIGGEVRDTAGRGLQGVRVTIQLVQDSTTPSNLRFVPRSTVTDRNGRFGFDTLSPGRYAIRSLMAGLGRWQDTVLVDALRSTDLSIEMSEDVELARMFREMATLNAATWQPVLLFTDEAPDVPPCPRDLQASVTLVGDTVVVTGCQSFGSGFPSLRGGVHRYGSKVVLDIVPVEDGVSVAIVSERRYRAKIVLPERARYVLYVRLNITSRTLDSELVTTRVVDLTQGTIERLQ